MARVTALAAIAGISFGVAALIAALALANGFRDEMREKILSGTAHITLMRRDNQPISDFRSVIARVRSLGGVQDAAATSYDGALLNGPGGSAYAVLRGVDAQSDWTISEIRRTLTEGSLDALLNSARLAQTQSAADPAEQDKENAQRHGLTAQSGAVDPQKDELTEKSGPEITSFDEIPSEAALPGVVIGSELAARTGLQAGDIAEIVTGAATLTPLGLAPRYRRVRVAGIFRSGLYEYDATWVYIPLATLSSFAEQPETSASVISIKAADLYDAPRVAGEVRHLLGEAYTTVDWQEANRPLFAALELERRMGLFVIALIILIAALNITTSLVLVVVERRSDIAILSAMGARPLSIMSVFMIEGAGIGICGALGGGALGLLACLAGNRYKLVSLPADIYSISHVPFHARAGDVLLAAAIAFLLSLLATLYPARAAARVRPAEALRDS